MPIRICLGYNQDDLRRAQRDMITAFESALHTSWGGNPARAALQGVVERLPDPDTTAPAAWLAALAQQLVALIATLQNQQDAALQATLADTQRECARLQHLVTIYQAHPQQAELTACNQAYQDALAQGKQQATRIAELEAVMQRTQADHARQLQHLERQNVRLQADITALNRIVVEQEEALQSHKQ